MAFPLWIVPAAISALSTVGSGFLQPEEGVKKETIPDWVKMSGAAVAPSYSQILHGLLTLAEQYGLQKLIDKYSTTNKEIDELIKTTANPSAALTARKASSFGAPSDLVESFFKVRGTGYPEALSLLSTLRAKGEGTGQVTRARDISPVYSNLEGTLQTFAKSYADELRRQERESQAEGQNAVGPVVSKKPGSSY